MPQTDPANVSCVSLSYLELWDMILLLCSCHSCGNQGGVFALQVKGFIFFSGFRGVLRLAVLTWFTAQLVEWRKTVSFAIVFGIFSELCSSFKLPSHALASRIYRFILGLGLIVTKVNPESLSDLHTSRSLSDLLHVLLWCILSVEMVEVDAVLSSLGLPPPLHSAATAHFLALQREKIRCYTSSLELLLLGTD